MNKSKIVVIGGGTMGSGIVTTFLLNKFPVQLIELNSNYIERSLININKSIDKFIEKEKFTKEEKEIAFESFTKSDKISDINKEADIVIEAINEVKETKLKLFSEINTIVNKDAVFASNTSSISITELAQSGRPEKFIGMHFMNPVPLMNLVEIIRGYQTSDQTYNYVKELTVQINKVPITVNDYPGFISNRILMPFINEACFALMEGVASIEDIDNVAKLGFNHPMGPLTLADFIGLDVCLNILEVLYEGFRDPKYRPCPLLRKMVAAGKFGRKNGEGFYKY